MPIPVTCECGKSINVPDAYAGKTGKCPACGRVVHVPAQEGEIGATAPVEPADIEAPAEPVPVALREGQGEFAVVPVAPPLAAVGPLQYMTLGGGGGGPIAPPPSDHVRLPTLLPEKLRQPKCPPIFLVFSTAGTDVQTDFDPSPVLEAFAEMFAKRLKKKFDVRLDPPPSQGGAPIAFVRIMHIQQGNRWLRYFLGPIVAYFCNAGTCFEVDGNVQGPSGQAHPFTFKHRSYMGMLGGGSLALLKLNARIVAKKIAASVKKAQ